MSVFNVCAVGRVHRIAAGVVAVCALALALATSAGAAGPWWQPDSVSVPANLHPGAAKSEVQEIRATLFPGEELLAFELKVSGVSVGTFVNEPFAKEFGLPAPTAKNIQDALESGYGKGNVEVVGSEAGTVPVSLVVNSIGEDAGRAVPELEYVALTNAPGQVNVLTPGRSDGTLIVTAWNMGQTEADGSSTPIVLRDRLPAGLVAQTVTGETEDTAHSHQTSPAKCSLLSGSLVECKFEGKLPPYEPLQAEVGVEVTAGASTGESSEMSVSGGGAPGVSLKRPIVASAAPVAFGPADYELAAFNENGTLDTQAGSHPYAVTTTIDLNRTVEAPYQPAQVKDLHINLPPGLVGNPTPFPQCSDAQFQSTNGPGQSNECPPDTVLGIASITIYEPRALEGDGVGTITSPVFNLKPSVGEPARFGFVTVLAHVVLDTAVRTGGDYGVTVSSNNITQLAEVLSSQVTFWGVPGDPIHDQVRGWACLNGEGVCKPQQQSGPPPLLSLPTSCTGALQTTLQADSWAQKGIFAAPLSPPFEPSLDGCNRLPFEPSTSVAPDSQSASSPSGLTVGIHVPQDLILNPTGLAESTVKDTTVTLPPGMALNPAAADGLQACSEAQIALTQDTPAACPEASKVGTVEIKTPLLPNALTGSVYLAAQNANPFGSLVALYLVAEDPISGTLVKLAGEVKPDPVTGQLVSTFKNTPQLPFEDLSLHFFGGSRAPLGTPALCGAHTTLTSNAPWSGNSPAEPSSTFQITSGPNGSACTDPLQFAPELTAGSTNIQAGAFTPFTMTVSREDGQQNIQQLQLHVPPGLLGLLSGVELCPEAQANAGTCGPNSQIGETTVSVGLGGNPFSVTGGKVYITGSYEGAPFGISVVVPAKAGPYDLGTVVVRGRIEVDPATAALTVMTNAPGQGYAIPHILDGIPLQIKHVNFTTTRPGFTFNPTNCRPSAIAGSLTSDQGATQDLSVPFQVTNCGILKFAPKFSVSTNGKTSKANGASLTAKLSYPNAPQGAQANIARVKVDLPKQLPSRLTTLQKACTNAQFELNPANCPAASKIGTATVTTPLLPVPLNGPAIFVSHGGEAFPSLTMVLQGYGVTVHLVGTTFISKKGITSTTFKTVPDVPFNTFELTLPQGPYSALTANGNLCTQKLVMPTEFVAQNGAEIHQNTQVSVNGCKKSRSLTRAQKLAKALKVCKKDKTKGKRVACEHQAHRKYGPIKKKRKK